MQRNKDGLLLCQGRYAYEILQHVNMSSCKPINTPLATAEKLSKIDGEPLGADGATRYRSIVRALQYLTLTRPDISFSINKICQFLHCPTMVHFAAVKRILRYIKGTLNVGLKIRKTSSMLLSAFADADWAGYPDDHSST